MLTRKQHGTAHLHPDPLGGIGHLSPSFEEMKEALDLKSKSGVHRLISALEERGFIRRLPNRARALEVLRQPDSSVSKPASVRQAANGNSTVTPLRTPAKAAPAPAQ